MGTVNSRDGKLYLDFRYNGVRCREHTVLADTASNRKKLGSLLSMLEQQMRAGTFDYGHHFPNSQVKGMDISTEAISQAQQHYQLEGVTFEVMDVSQLSYPDGRFDLVCAFQTHFHWPNLTQAMLEIKRVLTNDGLFLIACEQSKINYYLPDLK